MDSAHEFFDNMLADRDEVHDLLSSVNNDNDEFEFIDSFDIDFDNCDSLDELYDWYYKIDANEFRKYSSEYLKSYRIYITKKNQINLVFLFAKNMLK